VFSGHSSQFGPLPPPIGHSDVCRSSTARHNTAAADTPNGYATDQTGACTQHPGTNLAQTLKHQVIPATAAAGQTAAAVAQGGSLTAGVTRDAARLFCRLGPGALLTLLVTLVRLEGSLLAPDTDAFWVAGRLISGLANCNIKITQFDIH
jgi:hypothetical protein